MRYVWVYCMEHKFKDKVFVNTKSRLWDPLEKQYAQIMEESSI